MNEKTKENFKNGLKNFGLVSLGVGLGVGIVGKLYTDLVKDYNNLTEKTNKYADFINNHDFYEREEEPKPVISTREKKLYYTEEIVDEERGVKTRVFGDPKSGLKVCTVQKLG